MSPLTWLRLRPRWVWDVTFLAAGFTAIVVTVVWANHLTPPGASVPVAPPPADDEPLLPLWAQLLSIGAGAGFAFGTMIFGLRSRNRSTAQAASSITAEFEQLRTTIEHMSSQLTKIDAAISGYNGYGGILQRIAAVEVELRTVDDRIKKSRHDLRDALAAQYAADFDRVNERLTALTQMVQARYSGGK